ncbi:MAG: TIGR02099 family protein, partial [Comamonadaceae bacterium]
GYAASLDVRDGIPEFGFTTSLQGLGLDLPAPLGKAAAEALPVRFDRRIVARETRTGTSPPPLHDRVELELGGVAAARYLRDVSGPEPRVLSGGIGVGLEAGESLPDPERGVLANLRLGRFDVDAWQGLFDEATRAASPAPAAGGGSASVAAPPAGGADLQGYLPTTVALRAQSLSVAGRQLHDLVLGGSREGAVWRANVDANELNGYVEYRAASGSGDGRVYARLARLRIEGSGASQVESLLDEQPETLPALDVVIDDFELLGKRLGRAEILAVNRGGASREWRLDKLAFTNRDATFQARGSWTAVPGTRAPGGTRAGRRMAMDFGLDIGDAGALLGRFGMDDVLRRGTGRMEGRIAWQGSPLSLDYPSLDGQLNIDLERGQFLKADPGLAKLLSVLSLQSLPRRLTLDFRDVFSQGFAFDFIRGDAAIDAGIARSNNLQMKGVNAAVLMDGSADIAQETQALRVVIVPEIDAGTAALVATAINPAVGIATFLAQMVLRRPLIAAATQEFQVDGAWDEPRITKVPRRLLAPAAESSRETPP